MSAIHTKLHSQDLQSTEILSNYAKLCNIEPNQLHAAITMDVVREMFERVWVTVVATELFCFEHKAIVAVISLLLLAAFVLMCLRRGKAQRELVEGGRYLEL